MDVEKYPLAALAGFEVAPDVDQPGLWVWKCGQDGCDSSFRSEEQACADAEFTVTSTTMGALNIRSEDWDAMSESAQEGAVREIYGISEETAPGPR